MQAIGILKPTKRWDNEKCLEPFPLLWIYLNSVFSEKILNNEYLIMNEMKAINLNQEFTQNERVISVEIWRNCFE